MELSHSLILAGGNSPARSLGRSVTGDGGRRGDQQKLYSMMRLDAHSYIENVEFTTDTLLMFQSEPLWLIENKLVWEKNKNKESGSQVMRSEWTARQYCCSGERVCESLLLDSEASYATTTSTNTFIELSAQLMVAVAVTERSQQKWPANVNVLEV